MKKSIASKLGALGPAALLPLAAVLLLAVGSCYNPSITNGGLRCAEGGQCPEGYACHPSGRCYKPDTGPVDCGSTAICSEQPAANQECSLACQSGCGCGFRCNVTKNGPRCVAAPSNPKALGQVCMLTSSDPGYDDCGPGLVCLREACGGLNRCYRLCTPGSNQCGDLACNIPVETGNASMKFTACDVPRQDCDPLGKTGCPTGLTCFLLNNDKTVCDCPTNQASATAGTEGAPCTLYSDCRAGLYCVSVANGAAPTCRSLCSTAKPTCPMGTTCKAAVGITKFQICAP